MKHKAVCPCRAIRLGLLGVAAVVAAWAAFGQETAKPSNPFGAAVQRAAAAASAVAAAASSVSTAANDAVAAAASAAALPGAAASAVRAATGALLAVPASAPGAARPAAPPAGSAAPRATSAAASAPQAPCVQASDGSSFCAAPPLQLVFKTVALPPGRLGTAYGPKTIVQGGTPPYSLTVVEGKLPVGMELSDDGQLGGVPTTSGLVRFTLSVRDAATPPLRVQQPYALRIEAPKLQAAASAPAPAASATLTAVSREDAEAVAAQFSANQLRIYQLAAADVDKLLEPPAPAASDAAADTLLPQDSPATGPAPVLKAAPEAPTEPGPTPEQLQDMLKPLIDVSYATESLFEQALEMHRCTYYSTLVQEAARKQGLHLASVACPPAKAAAPAPATPASKAAAPPATATTAATITTAAGDAVPLNELYTRLLPPGLKTQITTAALKRHELAQAKPVQWVGNDCGCVPEQPVNEIYGLYPFWLAQGAPQAIDFSQFTRIGFFGGVLNDAGRHTLPPHWNSQDPGFARMAHRHGVALDLVVYRRQWTRVLAMSATQQDAFARQAATDAIGLVDTPLTDWFSRLKPVLMPLWGEQTQLYSGLTVFFDNLPTERAQADKFRTFYKRYVGTLIAEMQRTGRRYALNLVMPDHLVGEDGPFNFQDLLGYVESAERATDDKAIEGSPKLDYHGTTDISVNFLVLLSEGTSAKKKTLRARIDNTDAIQGHKRVAFLNSLVPVLFYPGAGKPAPMPPPQRKQMDDDLAYLEWQFGGVGFWPVPVDGTGMSADVTQLLVHNDFLGQRRSSLSTVCGQVCVNRSAVRLLFNGLLLVGVLSLGAYALSCQVRRLGTKYLLYLWAGGIATLLVGIALLSCDPHLAPLRGRNYLLYALLAVGVVAGVYITLKPRDDPP